MTKQYINYLPIKSHGALINIIEAPRNEYGKTFTAQLWLIKRFLKSGKKFIWVRRTEEETLATKRKFFKPKLLRMLKLTADDVRVKGDYGYIKRGRKWVDCVQFCSLSRAATQRSVDDPDYNIMIVDEAFATPSRMRQYAGNEVTDFIDLFISKKRDHNMTAFLLGNKEVINNPYYDYFGIDVPPDGFQGIRKFKNGELLVFTAADVIGDRHVNTLLSGTGYGDYMFKGTARTQSRAKIAIKPKKAHFYAAFDFGRPFTLWSWQGKLYACTGADVSRLVFVSRETMAKWPREIIIDRSNKSMFSWLQAALQRGKVFYTTPLAAEVAESVFLTLGLIK